MDNIMVAVISAGGGVVVAVLGPTLSAWLKRAANGRVEMVQDRMERTRWLEERVEKLETMLAEKDQMLSDHTRALTELGALIKAHLREHPTYDVLYRVLEEHEQRTRRPSSA